MYEYVWTAMDRVRCMDPCMESSTEPFKYHDTVLRTQTTKTKTPSSAQTSELLVQVYFRAGESS